MKLFIYSKKTYKKERITSPLIRFRINNGLITINNGIAKILELKKGDYIIICQDVECSQDWFITKNKDGFLLNQTDHGTLFFKNKKIVRDIQKCVNTDKDKFSMMISKESFISNGMLLFPILTKSIK